MSKLLEELENLAGDRKIYKSYEVIEKELKRLEELEKAFDSLSKDDEKAKKELSKEIEKNRGLEALKSLFDTMPFAFLESNTMRELKIIEKELKALELIKKYVGIQEYYDDIFPYEIVDKQYSSSGSDLIITKEEYDLLKEVLNA